MSASEDDTQAQLRKSNAANVRNQATILEQAEDAPFSYYGQPYLRLKQM